LDSPHRGQVSRNGTRRRGPPGDGGGHDRDRRIALETIEFDTGSAQIEPESKSTIQEVAKLLTDRPKLTLEIVGHTDNVGRPADNLRLSANRARAIVADLTGSFGIPRTRLRSSGMGQTPRAGHVPCVRPLRHRDGRSSPTVSFDFSSSKTCPAAVPMNRIPGSAQNFDIARLRV
jgi:hypothetical protein